MESDGKRPYEFQQTKPVAKKPRLQSSNLPDFEDKRGSNNDEPVIQYVTSVQGNTIDVDAVLSAAPAPLVIPVISNNRDEELKRQAEQEILNELYGSSTVNNENSMIIEQRTTKLDKKQPLLLAGVRSEVQNAQNEDERFKLDLNYRASDLDVKSSAYESVPVEQFGAALLRGMGWNGQETTTTTKKDGDKIEVRPGRLGLGATPRPPDQPSRGNGSNRGPKSSSSSSATAAASWERKVVQRLNAQQLLNGDIVLLREMTSRYAGKRAEVTKAMGVPGLNKVRIRLEGSGEVVDVDKKDVVLLEEADLANRPYQYPEPLPEEVAQESTQYYGLKTEEDSAVQEQQSSSSSHSRKPDASNKSNNNSNSKGSSSNDDRKKDSSSSSGGGGGHKHWLRTGIRVKIVSKKVSSSSSSSSGKSVDIYLEKATVLDVPVPGLANLRVDRNGLLVDNVKEKYLETVLPQVGGLCVVLTGSNKGETATLIQKHSKGKAQVQFTDSFEMQLVDMDDIAAIV